MITMANESAKLQPGNPSKPELARVIAASSFSGPLPPPQILQEYNRIVPGSANRIIAMAEKQADHRRRLETQVISSDVTNSRVGLICGLLIGLGGLVAATIIAIYGNPQAGVGMGFVTLGSLVGVFVYGSRLRIKERQEKWARNEPIGR
ncbi:MAG: DUF2335 domain-containing protein [Planctomycetaceae bacterium]|nr:DUF2335 domain-containing protein [Planctomycetaceae bacterium]